jgi:pimeloyl-ACP methyl ester carboxylesterase
MSLGGATTWTLAARRPDLTRRVVLVDATPGGTGEGGAAIGAFIHGPPSFDSID